MNISVKIYKCDVPNANAVIYPRDELEKAVHDYNKSDNNFVTFETYPPKLPIDLSKVCGKAQLEFNGEYVVANIKLLDIPIGDIVKDMLMSPKDVSLSIIPTANATLNDDRTVSDVKRISLSCGISNPTCRGNIDENLFYVEKDKE